jgi:hypothetical protein
VLDAELSALRPAEREALIRLAAGEPLFGGEKAPASVARALHTLVADGVIRKSGRGRYEIRERLLARHLVRENV